MGSPVLALAEVGGRFGVQLDEGAVTCCSGSGKQLQQEWGQIPTSIRDRTQPNPWPTLLSQQGSHGMKLPVRRAHIKIDARPWQVLEHLCQPIQVKAMHHQSQMLRAWFSPMQTTHRLLRAWGRWLL